MVTDLGPLYERSKRITEPLLSEGGTRARSEQQRITRVVQKEKEAAQVVEVSNVHAELTRGMQKYLRILTSERDASSWLTTRPLERLGFALTKSEFRDALSLRYGWELPRLPAKCVCGAIFSTSHAKTCLTGGFIHARHDEVRDLFAELVAEVAYDVEVEPRLKPLHLSLIHI